MNLGYVMIFVVAPGTYQDGETIEWGSPVLLFGADGSQQVEDVKGKITQEISDRQAGDSLHWALDISFREDECRVRTGHSAEKFSVLRRIALNLLKKNRTLKVGVENKRLRAGWDNDYLLKVLLG